MEHTFRRHCLRHTPTTVTAFYVYHAACTQVHGGKTGCNTGKWKDGLQWWTITGTAFLFCLTRVEIGRRSDQSVFPAFSWVPHAMPVLRCPSHGGQCSARWRDRDRCIVACEPREREMRYQPTTICLRSGLRDNSPSSLLLLLLGCLPSSHVLPPSLGHWYTEGMAEKRRGRGGRLFCHAESSAQQRH